MVAVPTNPSTTPMIFGVVNLSSVSKMPAINTPKSGVVAFKIDARPEEMYCCPQTINWNSEYKNDRPKHQSGNGHPKENQGQCAEFG